MRLACIPLAASLPLILAACASSTVNAPQPMSAAEHRARAAQETAAADAQETAAEPAVEPSTMPVFDDDNSEGGAAHVRPLHWQRTVMPQTHDQAARRHLEEARALEASEDEACQGIPREQRAECPLVSPASVESTLRGVRIGFHDEKEAIHAVDVIRCQQAFARTRAYSNDLPKCIVYARGLVIARSGQVVELYANDPAEQQRLRENIAAHMPHH